MVEHPLTTESNLEHQRRRRLLNSAQGWSVSDNPGYATQTNQKTLKGLANRLTLSGFFLFICTVPRVVAVLQPWAEISERLRRFSNLYSTGTPFAQAGSADELLMKPRHQIRLVHAARVQTFK